MGTPRHHNRNSCQNSPNGSLRLAPNGPQLSPPIEGVKKKISSISNQSGNSEGLFGMRNGRAHTYCSPRPVHFSVDPVTTNHRPPLIHTRCVNSKSHNISPNTSATAAATKLQKIMAAFAIGNAHTFSNSQNKKEQNLPEKLPELSPKLRKESPTPLNGILVNLPQSPSPTSRSPHSQSISSTTTTTTLLPLLGSNGSSIAKDLV
ncbi:hypothetical protein Ddc_17330 [Ditylenchus destructor]|nr:hypothetical protein Ddc_17330 [Ditylenchus destructor]